MNSARGKLLLEGTGWYTAARAALWMVIATASIKPAEILGLGEQVYGADHLDGGPIDLAFRCLVLGVCLSTTLIALIGGRIRTATLIFLPFITWGFLVAVGQQSDFFSVKQLASYATWILFFISANALLDQPDDFKNLRLAFLASVLVSALGGVLQFALGHAPMIGLLWDNIGFNRIHTGAGGILLDAFTPYCAAFLFLAASAKRPALQIGGVLLVLWASGNILRGGILGFTVGLVWLLFAVPKNVRMNLLKGTGLAILLVALCFGGKIVQKSISSDNPDNTSEHEFSTSGRIENWPMLIGWIRQEPIWGHGPNADMMLLMNSDAADLRAAHNELLSTAVNFGIVGTLLLWLPLLGLLLATLRLAYRHRRSQPEALWGAGAVLLMVAVLSLTDNTLRIPGVMILALAPACVALNRQEILGGAL